MFAAGRQSWYDSTNAQQYSIVNTLTSLTTSATQSVVDSSNNLYVCYYYDADDTKGVIAKYNSIGQLVWANDYSFGVSNKFYSLDVDNAGYVYAVSLTHILKLNASNGSIVFDKVASDGASQFLGVKCAPNGQILVSVFGLSAAVRGVMAIDSTGAIQWTQRIRGTTTFSSEYTRKCVVDSSNNIYVAYNEFITGPSYYDTLTKLDSTGSPLWSQRMANNSYPAGGQSTIGTPLAVDSSGNVYMSFITDSGSAYLIKFNSSGTAQWQRELVTGQAGSFSTFVDANDNVFLLSSTETGSNPNIAFYSVIAKYNTSGTLQWQRLITGGDDGGGIVTGNTPVTVNVNSAGTIVVSVDTAGTAVGGGFNLSLPTNGSLTGTYIVNGKTITYSTSSFTEQAGGVTNSSQTSASGTLTTTLGTGTTTTTATSGANSVINYIG